MLSDIFSSQNSLCGLCMEEILLTIFLGWCYFRSETDGNKWPQNAIFRLAQMVPPIECHLGYRFRIRTLNPNPNPNPKSNGNLCSAKRHPNKVQNSVINTSYFVGQGVGV